MSTVLDFLGGLAILVLVFGPLVYSLGGFRERRQERQWEELHGKPRGSLRRSERVITARRKVEHAQRELERARDAE